MTNTTQEIKFLWDAGLLALHGTLSPRTEIKADQTRGSQNGGETSSTHSPRSISPTGKISSLSQAISPGSLFCRMLQRDLVAALEERNQMYEVPCPLSEGAREELTCMVEITVDLVEFEDHSPEESRHMNGV